MKNSLAADPLLTSGDLTPVGSFLLPGSILSNGLTGAGLTWNPAGNNGAGSFFVVGNQIAGGDVSEVSLPTLVNSSNINSLNTASVVAPNNASPYMWDITNGHQQQVGSGGADCGSSDSYVNAALLLDSANNRLIGTTYITFDATYCQALSHYAHGLALSANTFYGYYALNTGQNAAMDAQYMGNIPSAYQSQLGYKALSGAATMSIMSRASCGPALFAFNPADIGVKNPAPALPLTYYDSAHHSFGTNCGNTESPNIYITQMDRIAGLVFPDNTRSVLLFGRHGAGASCYGEGGVSGGDCYDPQYSEKGTHSYPYYNYVWAYDVGNPDGSNTDNTLNNTPAGANNTLTAVKLGIKSPWQLYPYAVWSITLPTPGEYIMGAAWDPVKRYIYLTQYQIDGNGGVAVHAFSVNGSSSSDTTQPAAPGGLSVY